MLTILLLPLGVGLAVGVLLGGSVRGFADPGLRAVWLLWAAAGLQLIQLWFGLTLAVLIGVFGLVVIWIVTNLRGQVPSARFGLLAMLLGLLANGLTMALNGRMPYSRSAAVAAGLDADVVTPKNVPADADVRLGWLGDVLPVSPLRVVVSAGDVLIGCGVAVLVVALMCHAVPAPRTGRR
ncbi:MAG: DUF5317 family protein [Pseudonocardiales bacterium]